MGHPFTGVFFAGLMITESGPKLIEYNARFGDPECQVLMSRLESDIVPALMASTNGTLDTISLDWSANTAITIVMASKGYPGAYPKGTTIKGIKGTEAATGVNIFHAGTKIEDGEVKAIGGRVLNVTAMGPSVGAAQKIAYKAVHSIDWPEGFYRTDIGWRAIAREEKN